MIVTGTVVHAEVKVSRKGDTYTNLFVPLSGGVVGIYAKGDQSALAGCQDATLTLRSPVKILN